jgi:hypothetical protein
VTKELNADFEKSGLVDHTPDWLEFEQWTIEFHDLVILEFGIIIDLVSFKKACTESWMDNLNGFEYVPHPRKINVINIVIVKLTICILTWKYNESESRLQ